MGLDILVIFENGDNNNFVMSEAVSYTHLTLPTIA